MKTIENAKAFLGKRMRAAGLSDMTSAVVSLGLIAIIGAVVLIVLAGLQTSSQVFNGNALTPQGAAYNAIAYGITGVSTIMQYLPLVALVIVAAVIITIVVLAFAFGTRGRGTEI
jgi:hypothetical protein